MSVKRAKPAQATSAGVQAAIADIAVNAHAEMLASSAHAPGLIVIPSSSLFLISISRSPISGSRYHPLPLSPLQPPACPDSP
eukprot:11207982-Alexandrium_andersonii.AAC.1